MPLGSDQVGPLVGIDEDVAYSAGDANALSAACRASASLIEGQAGSRSSAVSTAKTHFKGRFSRLFSDNASVQAADATNLVTALRDVATKVDALTEEARKEQARRETGRKWKRDHDNRNWAEKTWDAIFGEDPVPIGPEAKPLPVSVPQPVTGKRETPAPGSETGSTAGTSSAAPADLRSFASTSQTLNDALSGQPASLRGKYETFTASCKWGGVSASGVFTAYDTYLTNNGNDVTWANTVAAAFEAVGGEDGISTVSDAALQACLEAAGVSVSRTQITIEPASVQGGQVTTGYADDPVNTLTGNFMEPEIDLAFAGGCGALALIRVYNSSSEEAGAFGPGWSSALDARLELGDEAAVWVRDDGAHVTFPRLGDGWGRAVGANLWLTAEGAGAGDPAGGRLVVGDNDGGRWVFTAAGAPVSGSRGAGTTVSYVRSGGRVVRVDHERGRSVCLTWDEETGRVVAARASDGREVVYSYDGAGRLVGAAGGDSGGRSYEWDEDSGRLGRVVDADGVVEADNVYDGAGRVLTQRSADGRVTRYSYLPGLVTQVADADGGRANTWIYDSRGRLIGVVDAAGNRQSAAWDRWGNQVMAADRDGARTVRVFDGRGRLVEELTGAGVRSSVVWDESDRVVEVRATPGDGPECVTRFAYEGADRHPSRIVDPEGGVTAAVWEDGLLTRVTDPTGRCTALDYDAFGDVVAVTNGAGERARLERDGAGRVTASISPAGRVTRYVYDSRGACTGRIDPDGAVWGYEYSAAGRLLAAVDPLGNRVEVVRDEAGRDAGSIDALGRRLTKEFDDLGNLAALRLPDGSSWEFVHDALSRLTRVADASGATWSLEHDAVGHVTAGVDPTGVRREARIGTAGFGESLTDGAATWRSEHDPLGRLIAQAGPDGAEMTYRYDRCGRVIESADPDGGTTLFERDAAGRVVRVTMASGASYTYEYDGAGRWCASVSTGGARYEIGYDADGNIATETWPTGEVVVTEHDRCGRPVRRVEPGAGTTTLGYDRCGRVVRVRDPYYGLRRYAYDAAGQIVAVTNALGGVTRFVYDECGRPVRTIDPAGGVTSRTFDRMGRVSSLTDPLGRTTRYSYDGAGRPIRTLDAAGRERTLSYDRSGRLTAERLDGRLRRAYALDEARASLEVTDYVGGDEHDPDGSAQSWQWWWNWRGEMTRARQGSLHTTYDYDADGRVVRMVRPDGEATAYEYDREGRVCAFTRDGVGRVSVERDLLGRAVCAVGDGVHIAWQWENGFLVRQVTHRSGRRSVVDFARDADGRIVSRTVDGATTSFTYDAAGQLTGATGPDGRRSYSWDALGRMTRRSEADATTSFTYDAAGQLTGATGPDGAVAFSYDELGRRTGERGPGGRRRLVWDDDDRLVGVTTLVQRGDRLEVGRQWDLAWGADGELAAIDSTDLVWDRADGLAVPVSAGGAAIDAVAGVSAASPARAGGADAAGAGGPGGPRVAPTWVKTQDDPWATPASLLDVGEGISITPRATVAFGGLEVMGARVYDPATGSFLSVDPLLAPPEAAWASNPYSYAGNDPVGFSDPTGLAPVSDAQLAAYNQAHSGAISQAWNAASSWVKDNWQYIAAAAVVAVGVGLCITGVGSGLGATILIGAATSGVFSAGTQYITTGKIDPKSLAADIAIGGATAPIGGGVESAVGSALSRTGLCQAGRNILTGAASSAVEGGVSDGLSYLAGPGPHTVGGLASSVGGGAAGGGLTGGATAKITNHMQGLTGWACFTADTPVVMADGSTRPIAQVEVGDRVLAHNPHTGVDEAREVLDTPVHEDAVTWRVSTDDGGTVTTTPTHRFWVQGAGWTKAEDLVPGDRLRATAGPGALPSTTENPHTDGATGRAEDDPHANIGGADGAVVVESAPTDQTATVHNLTIHGLTNYYIITTTGTRALVHNTYESGSGLIEYGPLDSLGRATGVEAYITPDMINTGTKANQGIRPPGFVSGSPDVGHARGHLLGKQLGGSGDEERNLVTLWQNPVNTPVMRGYETTVRGWADAGNDVLYSSTPIYEGSNPMPVGVTLSAESSAGHTLDVSVINRK